MPSKFVTRSERCPDCLCETIVVTVEQLLTQRGEVVASTVVDKAPCENAECIGSGGTAH